MLLQELRLQHRRLPTQLADLIPWLGSVCARVRQRRLSRLQRVVVLGKLLLRLVQQRDELELLLLNIVQVRFGGFGSLLQRRLVLRILIRQSAVQRFARGSEVPRQSVNAAIAAQRSVPTVVLHAACARRKEEQRVGPTTFVNLFDLLEVCLVHLTRQFKLPLQRPHLLFVLAFQLAHRIHRKFANRVRRRSRSSCS